VITKLSIVHFKAIASATIPLGPITVLVGPNDSGKSTILQALMILSRAAGPARLNTEQLLGCTPSVAATNGVTSSRIELVAEGGTTRGGELPHHLYRYAVNLATKNPVFLSETLAWDGSVIMASELGKIVELAGKVLDKEERWTGAISMLSALVSRRLSGDVEVKSAIDAVGADLSTMLLRLDARAIARPSPLGAPLLSDGSGLVGIVDELLTSGVGDDQIKQVNDVIRRLSPHVKGVAARLHPSGGKELHFALRSGMVVPASQMSDGVVLAAALVLISLASRTSRLLIEEPENGLHPRQLKVVADTIRSISETQDTQIILTTHSPLLLNHFAAEEVVLVTRTEAGVQAQPMSEARGLDELASEMALGELWYNVGDSNLARPA
jgi:ABC-type branched-subunit amino acid transport system ATPase component